MVMAKITINSIRIGPCIVNIDGEKVVTLYKYNPSNNKPRCDDIHAKIGFKTDELTIDA